MNKFYVKDCPDNMQVGTWIKRQLDWDDAKTKVIKTSKYAHCTDLIFRFNGDLPGIRKSIEDAKEQYGTHGWLTAEGEEQYYGGFSITYNPDLLDKTQPIHQHTLGTKTQSGNDFYAGSFAAEGNRVKNSYLDGMSFNRLTPAAEIGALGDFLKSIKISISRSRMAIVSGAALSINNRFHVDAEIFELIRLNIPVIANGNFGFEMQGKKAYVMEEGLAYTWQTAWPHRVFCHKISPIDRHSLVLGLSPWLTYSADDNSWSTNEFYGKKHPFDMFIDGDVIDSISLVKYK